MQKDQPTKRPNETTTQPLNAVLEALRGLQYGTVKLIVQDGALIRIERTEHRQIPRRCTSH